MRWVALVCALGYLICVPIRPEWTEQSDFEVVEGWNYQVRCFGPSRYEPDAHISRSSRQSASKTFVLLLPRILTSSFVCRDSAYFKNSRMNGKRVPYHHDDVHQNLT